MKSEKFATAVVLRRILVCVVFLGAAGFFSLFISHSFFLHAQGVLKGKASFYSKRATGSRTASGERLHHDSMTCAHKTLPFGTLLRVTNLSNGKDVIVRVTDRGPYRKGRIIDLSWGAAKAIGMLAQGVTQVIVERLPETTIPYKPEELADSLPVWEFNIAEIATGLTPVWQYDMVIDQKSAKRKMKATAEKSKRQVQPAVTPQKPHPATNTKPQPQAAEAVKGDVLDEINSSPNRSKAYLKRTKGR